MASFGKQEIDEIVLSHFGESEPARCPRCGWEVEIHSRVVSGFGLHLSISCRECKYSGEWQQPQPDRPWKKLHLDYFGEALASNQPIRCPFDDCFVSYAEFEGQKVQFICPYCNRRGLTIAAQN